jgi:hypothetical protein
VRKLPEEEKKDKQDRTIEILEEMLKWIKVASIPQVKKLLLDILPSDKEKIAYHFSDGEHGSQEVEKLADVSYVTVTKWWKIWARAGIAVMVGVRGGERAKRTFSLEDFGIEVPLPKEIKAVKKDTETPTKLIEETPTLEKK